MLNSAQHLPRETKEQSDAAIQTFLHLKDLKKKLPTDANQKIIHETSMSNNLWSL